MEQELEKAQASVRRAEGERLRTEREAEEAHKRANTLRLAGKLRAGAAAARLSESAAKFGATAEEKNKLQAELDRAQTALRQTAADKAAKEKEVEAAAKESRTLRVAGKLRAGAAAAREARLSQTMAAETDRVSGQLSAVEKAFAEEKDKLVKEKRALSARVEKERARVADLEGRLQTLESAVSSLRKSSEAECGKLKENAKRLMTDAAKLEAERDSLKAQLKGKSEMVAAFGFKAKVEVAVKSRLKSQVEELRREVAARSGAAEAARSRLAESEQAVGHAAARAESAESARAAVERELRAAHDTIAAAEAAESQARFALERCGGERNDAREKMETAVSEAATLRATLAGGGGVHT